MIRKIRIRNFKALSDTGVCEISKLTLLTGINGRGKSSFIQTLLLMSQSLRKTDGSPRNLFPNGDWCGLGSFKELVNVFNDDQPIVISFQTDSQKENDFCFEYRQAIEKTSLGEAVSIKVDGFETIDAGGESENDQIANGVPTIFETIDAGEEMSGGNMVGLPIEGPAGVARTTYSDLSELQKLKHLFFVSSDRRPAQNEEQIDESLPQYYVGTHGQYVLNVLSQCDDTQLEELKSKMDDIMDGATIELKPDYEKNRVYLYLDAVNEGRLFHPVNVGFGYSFIISTLLSLVLAKEGDTVIVENPEAHLHPQAQSRLMRYVVKCIEEKNIQVFIETHSDHVVNASLLAVHDGMPVDDVKILFFSSRSNPCDGIKVQNLELTQKGVVKNPPKGFCDQYGYDMRKIMGF